LTTYFFYGGVFGFFSGGLILRGGTYFLAGGGTLFLFSLIGIMVAISSSSRLSADGSLSDPELSPSSRPVVNYISFLFAVSSFYKSLAFIENRSVTLSKSCYFSSSGLGLIYLML
jgi:hypothetical protein